jgi:hypothetical protein
MACAGLGNTKHTDGISLVPHVIVRLKKEKRIVRAPVLTEEKYFVVAGVEFRRVDAPCFQSRRYRLSRV